MDIEALAKDAKTREMKIILRHWMNGGTGLTNFQEDRRAVYIEAVKRHGDQNFVVHEKSFPPAPDGYGGSLHRLDQSVNASEFWLVYYEVEAELMNLREDRGGK